MDADGKTALRPETTCQMTRFFAIALGSNIGDRLFYLNRALALIDRIAGLRIVGASRIYESKGWGRDDLDPFLNAVIVAVSDRLDAIAVLKELQSIEDKLGRQRVVHWGARTLDLDLLAVNDEVCGDPALTLPHPYIADRPFVYLPFREVAALHAAFTRLTEASEKGRAIEGDCAPTSLGAPVWGRTIDDPELISAKSIERGTSAEEETESLGRLCAPYFLPGDVISLNGEMGLGKSVLARGIARGLGVTGAISSPTYLLCKAYETPHMALEHWDFYRMESRDDLESAGFFSPPPDVMRIVEWPRKVDADSVQETHEVFIQLGEGGPESRRVIWKSSRRLPLVPFPIVAVWTTP